MFFSGFISFYFEQVLMLIWSLLQGDNGNNLPEVFCKNGILKQLVKFTRELLAWLIDLLEKDTISSISIDFF